METIGNRLIGCVVVCGKINTKFMYTLDDLISGGANMMIEVVRQSKFYLYLIYLFFYYKLLTFTALADLAKMCEQYGYFMPKELFFQFDNCGENKVIEITYSCIFEDLNCDDLMRLFYRINICSLLLASSWKPLLSRLLT